MPSNAPDGRGAEASNEGGGEVSGLDDRDLAGLSDANLAAEVSKETEGIDWMSLSLNVLGTMLGVPPMLSAIGNYAMGNVNTAAGMVGSAFGIDPGITLAALGAASGKTPEQIAKEAAMGVGVSAVAPSMFNGIRNVTAGLTGSNTAGQLAGMMGTTAAIQGGINSINNPNRLGTTQGINSNNAMGLAGGIPTRPFNPYLYASQPPVPQGMLTQKQIG